MLISLYSIEEEQELVIGAMLLIIFSLRGIRTFHNDKKKNIYISYTLSSEFGSPSTIIECNTSDLYCSKLQRGNHVVLASRSGSFDVIALPLFME